MKSLHVRRQDPRWRLLSGALLGLLLLTGCDSVQVDAPELSPPLLQNPRDAQPVTMGTEVTFSWEPVPGARRYECEIRQSDDDGKSRVTEYTDVTTATMTFDAPGNYSWRVRARNTEDAAGPWSESWELRVQVAGDPD